MSPPRPPSPPSGPPMGTNFSRRNETMPEPPSPAFTFTTTRSMNILFPLHSCPEHADCLVAVVPDDVRKCVNCGGPRLRRGADVQRAVQMRMQLPLLIG